MSFNVFILSFFVSFVRALKFTHTAGAPAPEKTDVPWARLTVKQLKAMMMIRSCAFKRSTSQNKMRFILRELQAARRHRRP